MRDLVIEGADGNWDTGNVHAPWLYADLDGADNGP